VTTLHSDGIVEERGRLFVTGVVRLGARLCPVAWLGRAADLSQAGDGMRPQHGRVAGDAGLARLLDPRHPPVERRDQLLEIAGDVLDTYRHAVSRLGPASRLEAFQISPHALHRQ
jgi:hypothetical protein